MNGPYKEGEQLSQFYMIRQSKILPIDEMISSNIFEVLRTMY